MHNCCELCHKFNMQLVFLFGANLTSEKYGILESRASLTLIHCRLRANIKLMLIFTRQQGVNYGVE